MRRSLAFAAAAWLLGFGMIGTAVGWYGPSTHAGLASQILSDPVLTTLLPLCPGVDWDAVRGYAGEPTDAFHLGEWGDLYYRSYIDTAGVSPWGNYWNALDETTHLQYLTHLAADSAVISKWHHPAMDVNSNINQEKNIEFGTGLWLSYIPVTGTCNYTNWKTGQTHNYTGAITDIMNNHYFAVLDNATWSRDNLRNWSVPFGYFSDKSDYDAAADNATIQAQMFQRAVVADYILAKELPVVTADNYIGTTGGSITFDESASYDPDAISWNSDGSYSQMYGINPNGLWVYLWDVNGDMVWDLESYDNTLSVSADQLLALGMQTDQWNLYTVLSSDNEGKIQTAQGYVWIYGNNMMMAVPEPGSFILLAMAAPALLLLKRKRRS